MTLLFELRDGGVRFGPVQALAVCNLHIKAGERLALVGANGSGKSTLLRTLHGLQPLSSGELQADAAARQAMLFQRPYMLRASVLHNVALGLWLRGAPWRDARAQAMAALDRVGLAPLAARPAKSLSGGQQQRVALARAWACKPQVLLLDEPTASLDPSAKREVERLMAEFANDGMTLIFSSHNLGQVKRLASRVIYLENGELVADKSVDDFFTGALPAAATAFLKGEMV
ncbi:MAG: amino acid transporter ATP-binding protein family [Polaromonas sp.]|nr:amino acid transporter ATP-binding protein family [Polaromonas sp.]